MGRIGTQIQAARTQQKMTQKQLAKKVGVAEKYIQEVENGTRIINDTLLDKISKVLGGAIGDTMIYDEPSQEPSKEVITRSVKEVKKIEPVKEQDPVQDVWNDAFGSVLATIPIYEYDLRTTIATKQLPIIGKKVEGHAKDKVAFIRVQDHDMIGFRIAKGDIAFGHSTYEIENNGIYLVEWRGQRAIRQIKKLDTGTLLLISNGGSVKTETIAVKSIQVLLRLDWVELRL